MHTIYNWTILCAIVLFALGWANCLLFWNEQQAVQTTHTRVLELQHTQMLIRKCDETQLKHKCAKTQP